MATVVHGACNSPRQQQQQHHQCELSSTGSAATTTAVCLAASQHHHFLHQNPHSNPHQSSVGGGTATPVYSSVSKYLRPHTAPQMQIHQHMYDGNVVAANNASSYGTTLNQRSYIPMGGSSSSPTVQQHGYSSVQLPPCGSPGVPPPSSGEGYHNYWSHTHVSGNGRGGIGKRKTAAQLLAETKPFFMKPDSDRLSIVTPASPAGYHRTTFLPMPATPTSTLKRGRNSAAAATVNRQASYSSGTSLAYSTGPEVERRYLPRAPPNTRGDVVVGMHSTHTHTHMHQHSVQLSHGSSPHSHQLQHHHHTHTHTHHTQQQLNRHSAPSYGSGGNMLQTKLKLMLPPDNSRERDRGHTSDLLRKFDYSPSIGSENCVVGETSMPYMRKDEMVNIPPPLFLSSHSYEESYNYAGGESSSIDEPLILTDDYRPISPPAEYAAEGSHTSVEGRGRYNYQRSYSHSHEMTAESREKYDAPDAYNINSHKSLPDLHSQISRHSPHSEILSCCSRGNRSNKSVGESSLNRDSGGSSGHYTHRSEPCYRQRESSFDAGKQQVCCSHASNPPPTAPTTVEIRRDSGSSTQHSANSYCGYASPSMYGRTAAECVACRCTRNSSVSYDAASCDYFLNVPTPVVPEAFQDDYKPPGQSQAQGRERRYYSSSQSQQHQKHHHHQQQLQQHQEQQQQQHYSQTTPQGGHSSMRLPPNPCSGQSPGSTPSIEDISPPPIEFKRQKCIRLKNRNRLPVVVNVVSMCSNGAPPPPPPINGGSNSSRDAGYSPHSTFLFPKCIAANADADYSRVKSYGGGGNSRRSSCERVQNAAITVSAAALPPPPQPQPHSAVEMDQAYSNYTREIVVSSEISDLETFFNRMGLNDEKFNELYTASRHRRRRSATTTTDSDDSSTVFFSDVSTVDSMRLPDSTETQPQATQAYRPSEPPSIVERNARIIKWLVNMRKLENQK